MYTNVAILYSVYDDILMLLNCSWIVLWLKLIATASNLTYPFKTSNCSAIQMIKYIKKDLEYVFSLLINKNNYLRRKSLNLFDSRTNR